MKVADVIASIEEFAPLHTQEPWDHSGLQVGDFTAEVTAALLCVDVTEAVIAEAVERGCNLIIAHHPLLFHGLHAITGATPIERCVLLALRHNIAIYSSHTPMDKWAGGVSARMAQCLGLVHPVILSPDASDAQRGLGILADLPTPQSADHFIRHIQTTFHAPMLRHTHFNPQRVIKRVALCGGSGSEFISLAQSKGADLYLSADFKYHDFFVDESQLVLVDIGHYESEQCVKDLFFEIISKKIPTFALYYANADKTPICYQCIYK